MRRPRRRPAAPEATGRRAAPPVGASPILFGAIAPVHMHSIHGVEPAGGTRAQARRPRHDQHCSHSRWATSAPPEATAPPRPARNSLAGRPRRAHSRRAHRRGRGRGSAAGRPGLTPVGLRPAARAAPPQEALSTHGHRLGSTAPILSAPPAPCVTRPLSHQPHPEKKRSALARNAFGRRAPSLPLAVRCVQSFHTCMSPGRMPSAASHNK